MKILVACEYSGRVRDAFIRRGHDAMSCDLLPTDVPGPHYTGDVTNILGDGWDMLIAHPPCTYLTIAAEWCYSDVQKKKRGIGKLYGAERRAAREEALQFVALLAASPIKRIAIENPVGVISTRLGRQPTQTIQPYWFGEDASKATCLWLKNLPPLVSTHTINPRMVCKCGHTFQSDTTDRYGCPNCEGEHKALPRWGNQTDSGQNKLPPTADRWKIRSETYMGIAEAMADQWGMPNV